MVIDRLIYVRKETLWNDEQQVSADLYLPDDKFHRDF